jgi:uncharacterized membrane protein
MNDTTETNSATENTSIAKVIYILMIVSTIVGFTGIIGLIMAYVNMDKPSKDEPNKNELSKEEPGNWLQTHYRFQIRTYWIGLLYTLTGVFFIQFLIGYFILLFTFFWLMIRCAKGLKQLSNNQPVENLESWLFT